MEAKLNLILDIDGTLWNTTEVVAIAWNDSLDAVGLSHYNRPVTASMLQKEFGKPMDEIVNDLFPNLDKKMQSVLMDEIKRLEQDAVLSAKENMAYPDVIPTLQDISKYCNLFIVSNCQDGYIPLVTNKLGITDCILDYECFGNTGLSKAENISLILKRNHIDPNNTYYLGDTIGDYNSSSSAGVPFIYAAYGFGDIPDYSGLRIDKFKDLYKIIAP